MARHTPPKSVGHDAATQKLIDSELKDASSEERAQWNQALVGASSERVAEILQARRQMAESWAKQLAAAEATAEAGIAPAAHATPADGDDAVADRATTNGWSRIRSLAEWDASRLWPTTTDPGAASTAPSHEKERGPFGLPQIRGNHTRPEQTTAEVPNTAPLAHGAMQTASILSPASPTGVESPTAVAPGTPLPIALPTTPGAALWEDEVRKLISLLEAETHSKGAADREFVRKQAALRMLYVVANQPQRAQEAIPGLSAAEQEFWTSMFMALIATLDDLEVRDPQERATLAIAQLRTATSQLQSRARLQLRHLTFCEQIRGYGAYDPFAVDVFRPGQSLLIYAEIRNFTCEPTADGFYRSCIRSTMEISSSGVDAQLIDRTAFDPTEDLCRSVRSDYYHSYRIDLPPQLQPGPHVLRLTLTDQISGRQTSETLSFIVR